MSFLFIGIWEAGTCALLLRTKNRSRNLYVLLWQIWKHDNIFHFTLTFSALFSKRLFLQKYLNMSSVFPIAMHGSISVDLVFIDVKPSTPHLICEGSAAVGATSQSVAWLPAWTYEILLFDLELIFVAQFVLWDGSNPQKGRTTTMCMVDRDRLVFICLFFRGFC